MSIETQIWSSRAVVPVSEPDAPGHSYRRLRYGSPEPHLTRLDLVAPRLSSPVVRSLAHIVHLTDTHTVDTQSPGRFEFMQRYAGTSDLFHLVVPAQRPQEALNAHALDAMVRTVNALGTSPITGAPIQLAVLSGDNTDNNQLNELQRFLSIMQGDRVHPFSTGSRYVGVQSTSWNDAAYWHPEGLEDAYKSAWDFPAYPHLLDEAAQVFEAEGFQIPWLSLYGNHDALVLGTAVANPAFESIVTGYRKPYTLPEEFVPQEALRQFIAHPEVLLQGPAHDVQASDERRRFTRADYIRAHLHADGEPRGHGFTDDNLARRVAYYSYDLAPGVRLITLDTVNPGGHYQGSIGRRQLLWLEEQLVASHSHYVDRDGRTVSTQNDDYLVILCSHHGLDSLCNPLTNQGGLEPAEDDLPRVQGPEVLALLHRFPNVVLSLNGHTHRHRVMARPYPRGAAGGFWEITTGSLLDWPNQARRIELVQREDGMLALISTMVDSRVPPNPEETTGVDRIAAIHRELAANDPYAGFRDAGLQGRPEDRNVELLLPSAFPLR